MFSVLSYGRLVARAVLGGLSQTDPRAGGGGGGGGGSGDYGLVTAGCGFGKDFRKGLLKKGACYGDDACFVARHRSADVLGECRARVCPPLLPGDSPGRARRLPESRALAWSSAAGSTPDRPPEPRCHVREVHTGQGHCRPGQCDRAVPVGTARLAPPRATPAGA